MTEPAPVYDVRLFQRRGSQLELLLLNRLERAGLPQPEVEYRFAPPRRWRFDLSWPDRKLAVEVEGGVWTGGRHSRGSGYEADCVKYNEAVLAGWAILRVTGDMIKDGRAVEMIGRAFGNT